MRCASSIELLRFFAVYQRFAYTCIEMRNIAFAALVASDQKQIKKATVFRIVETFHARMSPARERIEKKYSLQTTAGKGQMLEVFETTEKIGS